MINLSRGISLFNKYSPSITRNIGHAAHAARNIGQAAGHVRQIGSAVNAMSGGRLGGSPNMQKIAEVTRRIEEGANNLANREGEAHQHISTISRKFNA